MTLLYAVIVMIGLLCLLLSIQKISDRTKSRKSRDDR